ncbi:hypothetical protein Misp01_79620 [Microtetraspora sp. NBRC 13810]|uniref:hypothetical protein n=1 Tax=Microtetraspora sp. NBRC 13810 TaxID=3030990 RepID=UPI0024A5AE82|nr:hypothetical protein [Microtetraspora sp. NBRC 13810]GLW12834.1 hypothetical protein Misp01_79620 [Microtetraspora sp. NBRC 13810]
MDEADLRSELIDLTGIGLGEVAALPDSAFAVALRRVWRDSRPESESLSVQYQSAAASFDGGGRGGEA